jgi:signal transduction histidine kinase
VVEAKRIEELSQALLDFVRSGAIEPRNVNPKDLITQCSHSIDARIAIDASRAPPSWPLDGFRMRQVFTNLLENAAQASGKDQPIEVRIAVEKGRLVVTIRDRGKGIASAETERIFEAFHTTRTQGVGLGLAIARRIVELHGGSIDAGNHEQGGAIFTVRLPKGASA